MDKMFDLILIGRGLSNLLFISQYLKAHQNLKILILEKNKKIDERFISTWQGPGLIDLKKEYNIFPIQSFNEISVSEKNNKIKRKIKPYKYQTYQYSFRGNFFLPIFFKQLNLFFNVVIERFFFSFSISFFASKLLFSSTISSISRHIS
jgi:hypothetical protein